MSINVTVPQLGESINEAIVGKWHKKVGDPVKADEPVVVLETDKVTVDVPAPAGGALTAIAHNEGDRVKVGEILGSITPGQATAGLPAPPSQPTAPPKAPPPVEARPTAPPPVEAKRVPAPSPVPLVEAKPIPASSPPARGRAGEDGRGTLLTPVARRVAEDNDVDLSSLRGSGAGGRILKDDVLQALDGRGEPEVRAPAVPEVPSQPAVPEVPSQPAVRETPAPPAVGDRREERVKMTPLRRRVAERLLAAQSNAAILTTFNEIDMSAVMHLRKAYQEKFQEKHGIKLGLMSFFVRASIDALKLFPQVNAEIDGDEVVFKHYYDIGVAVSGSRGLVVPVLRDADFLTMAEIERQIGELANKARTDRLTLGDLKGGTFTITNGGVFGSMLSTPILNPPQTGILGMHNVVDRPVVRDGQVVIRPVMYVALSYDHRLIDGREAVQFLVRIKETIEDPERLLLGV